MGNGIAIAAVTYRLCTAGALYATDKTGTYSFQSSQPQRTLTPYLFTGDKVVSVFKKHTHSPPTAKYGI